MLKFPVIPPVLTVKSKERKSERKKNTFFKVIKKPIICKYLKDMTNNRKKAWGLETVFSSLFSKFYTIETTETDATFQPFFVKYILKRLGGMCEISASFHQNDCNTITSRYLTGIKSTHEHNNHLGTIRDYVHFLISFRRESR